VATGELLTVYLIARNHNFLAGVQAAFEWDPGWVYQFGLWDCHANQVSARIPLPPGGPLEGMLTTAFDVVTGPEAVVIGRMFMTAGQGSLRLIESGLPEGTHVVDGLGGTDAVREEGFGVIEVGGPGFAPCELPVPTFNSWICCVGDECVTVDFPDECTALGGRTLGQGSCSFWCTATPPCAPLPVEPATWGQIKQAYR
jgi:hypothetical protein